MTPSNQFVADAQANCDAQMSARTMSLKPYVIERVAGIPEIVEASFIAYRNAVAAHAMHHLLSLVATFPADFPEQSAMTVLDGIIGGLNGELLTAIADDAIHPLSATLH